VHLLLLLILRQLLPSLLLVQLHAQQCASTEALLLLVKLNSTLLLVLWHRRLWLHPML
jgi:hypothetical protein